MHDLICGKLLGDGCLTKQDNRKPRFQFTHCASDKGWSEHCYEHLLPFLPLKPPKYRRITDSRIAKGFTESYIVQSRTSDELCRFYELWYSQSKKHLPYSYIVKHFNEKSLAWWYQDDGNFKQDNGIPRKIILSTDSFSTNENQFLMRLLQKKYGFQFSLDSQNRLLLYDQFQILYFLKLVSPHIHKSMSRKKRMPCEVPQVPSRSTLYLPTDLVITRPTHEINEQYKKLSSLVTLTEDGSQFFIRYIDRLKQKISTKPYQIKIHAEYKKALATLKHQTGLNISQLTIICFQL